MSLFSQQPNTKTIYFADDDQEDRMFLIDAVNRIDPSINIVEVENGEALLKILMQTGNHKESLILLDMNMPKMNGLETLAKLRTIPTLANIPSFMLSTSTSYDLSTIAMDLGSVGYFVKPVNAKALAEIATFLVGYLSRQ